MRISSAVALSLLAACSPDADGASAADDAPEVTSNLIECALHGAGTFTRECTVQRGRQDGHEVLIVRHPDGGFRRFEMLEDKRGLAPADGAEAAESEWREGGIGLAIGADRYRFPAAMLGDDPQ
jgi:hypothetical protein